MEAWRLLSEIRSRIALALAAGIAAVLLLGGCAANVPCGPAVAPDYYMVTAIASYRPVEVPGTQKKMAQADAENVARRMIMEYVGSMPTGTGETVNDLIARHPRMRADVLNIVRTAELVDWEVWPECNVRVWMRVDLNRVRQAILACR
jgi:hypothetical protein